MDRKKIIMISAIVGGYAGSYIPAFWGAGGFSMWGILFSAIGSVAAIWIVFRLGE